jgi:hypothetical protein
MQRFTDMMRNLGLFMRHYNTNMVLRGDSERVQSESYVLAITGPPGRATRPRVGTRTSW